MPDIRLDGFEEFKEKLKTIEKKAPDRIIDKLDEKGNELRREARKNTPRKTGKLRSGYRTTPVEKIKGGYMKGLKNTSPHFYIVEKGHRKVSRSGKELGWTEGVFMLERTVKELEEPFEGDLRKWLDELFKELS